MMFFGILIALMGLCALAHRFGAPGLDDTRVRMRVALSLALLFFGTDHIINVWRYLPMMPDFVPIPDDVVVFTGLCEIAGATGLLVPRVRSLAGIMLAIYFAAVFPANIKNAIDGLSVDGLPGGGWYYWVRLLFQPLAIWWSLYAAEVISWPVFKARRRPLSA
jgi:uncharacterized membrane protein